MPVWSDLTPCQLAIELRQAYYDLLSGKQEEVVRARGPNAEDEVRFTKANLSSLLAELRAAEQACAETTGTNATSRRRSFRLGARRSYS